jgi:HEAT repeat protein
MRVARVAGFVAWAVIGSLLVRRRAAQAQPVPTFVQRMGPEAWVARLSHPDPRVRRGAAYDIGHFVPPSPRIATDLATVLGRESDPSVLLAVVDALAVSRQHSMLLPFVTISRGETPPEVTAACIRALQTANDPVLGAALMRVNGYAPPVIVDAAARALSGLSDAQLGRIAAQSRSRSMQALLVLRALAFRADPRWSGFVLDLLRATSASVVLAAIETAVALRLPEAPAELVELARDANDRSIRRGALRALGALGDLVDPNVIRGALEDPLTRDAALDACATAGDARFVEPIAQLLDAPWIGDRRAAAEALGAIGGRNAGLALDRALEREHDASMRTVLWSARARIGDVTWVSRAMREPSGRWGVVARALRGSELRELVAGADANDARDTASWMLAGIYGEREAARIRALDARSVDERRDAAMSFVATRSLEADRALERRLTREDDEAVRVALVLALGVSGSSVADDAIVALLERESEAMLPAAIAAAQMAGSRRLRGAVPALRTMLANADDPLVRTVAAHALARIADPIAAGVLEEAARYDSDADARGAALIGYAIVRGPAALGLVDEVDRIAWSERLIDRVERARRIARGESADVPFRGDTVVHVAQAPPGSIWAASLPDGSVRFAVASTDGTVLLSGMPSTPIAMRQLGARR